MMALIMDPPSYGRGPKGEIWKIEEKIYPFIQLCTRILSDDPLFFFDKFLYDRVAAGRADLHAGNRGGKEIRRAV